MTNPSATEPVLIIGAGLAGLTCAKVLQEAHIPNLEIQVLEASDGPGGRVRTDEIEGFRLDRGFQVLFAAYPAVQRHLNLAALDPCAYQPGAVLVKPGSSPTRRHLLGDPLRDPVSLFPSLLNPWIPLADKLHTLRLRAQLATQSAEQILASPDQPTLDFIRRYGFSDRIYQNFLRPFYQGILLDPDLKTSARLFRFYFKMLAEGSIITPRLGMGQIAQQLAAVAGSIRYQSPVIEILEQNNHVTGVRLKSGETLSAQWVVCATDPPAAATLLGSWQPNLQVVPTPRSVTCVYVAGSRSLTGSTAIHLNANLPEKLDPSLPPINNLMELTQVSPDLAPPGKHLYSLVVLGIPSLDDKDLADHCLRQLTQWFSDIGDLRWLKTYRIPFAQFAQPPGIQAQLPSIDTPIKGLLRASEITQQSSIDGAISSGESAAQHILQARLIKSIAD